MAWPLAEKIAKRLNGLFPDIRHWVMEEKAERIPDSAALFV
jgi:hypothetical protein